MVPSADRFVIIFKTYGVANHGRKNENEEGEKKDGDMRVENRGVARKEEKG